MSAPVFCVGDRRLMAFDVAPLSPHGIFTAHGDTGSEIFFEIVAKLPYPTKARRGRRYNEPQNIEYPISNDEERSFRSRVIFYAGPAAPHFEIRHSLFDILRFIILFLGGIRLGPYQERGELPMMRDSRNLEIEK
ncbi:MAG: hypothetical protein PVH19_12950 [Planctomycetia bacterium]|jgi:hypothetical protein